MGTNRVAGVWSDRGEVGMISLVHIGLPLSAPWVPAEECEKIATRVAAIQRKMEVAGYRYDVMHASPDTGLTAFRQRLRTVPCDGVIIGGGVASDPRLADFKEQIVSVVRDEAPAAKVLEFDHALDVQVLVERAFGVA